MASLSGASPLPRGASTASFGVQRSTFRGTRFAHVGPVATAAAAAYRLAVSRLVPEGGDSSNWKRNGGVFVRCRRLEAQEAENMAEEEQRRPLRVGVICGGPSAERGISLNSARSVLDHIQGDDVHVLCYYIDTQLNAYAISPAQLYSNTPADFDFKLESLAQSFRSLPEFTEHLSRSVDIAFPVIHGRFGEDGGIQELLERANVPFVGTPSRECQKAFDKYEASQELSRQGFVTVPNFLVKKGELNACELQKWFSSNQLDKDMGKVVVKPARSGSSIGVTVAYGIEDALRKASNIISEGTDDKVLIEVFLEGGSEFTAIILDVGTASDRHPVVLLPTEVELQSLDSSNSKETIFDYRKKYLPTQQVAYHTPPRFPSGIIQHIREGAALLFKYFGLRDFARIDGWFFPSTPHLLNSNENIKFGKVGSGTIIYTDVNLISGMEQTSFLFQQASKVGFSHSSILHTIIQHACLRFPSLSVYSNTQSASSRRTSFSQNVKTFAKSGSVRKVFVIFGGETSERQVSLMSGTNVWLNLQSFDDLEVTPCLLAPENGYSACNHDEDEAYGEIPRIVWSLPYSIVLRHTTEEVFSACLDAVEPARATLASQLCREVMSELEEGLSKLKRFSGFDISNDLPIKFSLDEWIRHVKETDAIVFIAVHGGIGEDGRLQSWLEAAGVPYTGPGPMASKICMDKVSTSLFLDHLKSSGVLTIPKVVMSKEELLKEHTDNIWSMLTTKLQCETVCVKPTRDGCSTGVARLCSSEDLSVYTQAIRDYLLRLPPNMLSKAHGVIEMPNPPPKSLIFEPFIETDEVLIPSKSTNGSSHQLLWKGQSKWIEVTVGVIGKLGEMHSLSPSITVKEISDILSLEEKFQGGTGINLTPPPTAIINQEALQRCKHMIALIAHTLRLEGFSRIDAFVNVHSGEVLVIEVNTIPGMTPSTALIHQALAEEPPMYPREFFRKVLDLALQRSSRLLRASAVESED